MPQPYFRGLRQHSADTNRNQSVDEVAITRALAGDLKVRLSCSEIAVAIHVLDDGSRSAATIGRTLGVTARTVFRHRAQRRKGVSMEEAS